MKTLWFRRISIAQSLSRRILAIWLIAVGLFPLLHIGNATVSAILNMVAVAAGVLILLDQ